MAKRSHASYVKAGKKGAKARWSGRRKKSRRRK